MRELALESPAAAGLGMDAAILFADILLPLDPWARPSEFAKGEGPVITSRSGPGRHRSPAGHRSRESLSYVLDALRLIRGELDGKAPLIASPAAPFTIASYTGRGRQVLGGTTGAPSR